MKVSYGMLKESSLGHMRRDVKITKKREGGEKKVESSQLAGLVDRAEDKG